MFAHVLDSLAERCQLEADTLSGDPPSLFQSLVDLCVAFTRPDAFQSSFSSPEQQFDSNDTADEFVNHTTAIQQPDSDRPLVPHIALFLTSLVLSLWLCLLWRSRQSLMVKQPIRLEMDGEENDSDDVDMCLAVAPVDKRWPNEGQGTAHTVQLPARKGPGGELQSAQGAQRNAHPAADSACDEGAHLIDLKMPD